MEIRKSAKSAFDLVTHPLVTTAANAGYSAYLSHLCFKDGVRDIGDALAVITAIGVALFSRRAVQAWNERPSNNFTSLNLSR